MKIKSINTELYNGDVYNLRIKSENDTNHNYFANGINVSNCHKASSTSISNILKLCSHCKRRFGLSGTIPKPGTLDRLTVMSQMGPNIANISADFLIGEGFITPCEIFVIEMDYAKKEVKEGFSILHGRSEDDRKKLLNLEKNYAINNKERLDFITDLILKNKKNALVLFHRIEYGNALYNTLRQKSNRRVFYIDGGVSSDNREIQKDELKEGEGKIMVASFQTFATGISINNIHTIFLTESFKSDVIIRQSIGRGLRKHDDKDKLIIFDFVDDYRHGKFNNYLWKHGKVRQEIYKEQKFPFKIKQIKL